MEKFTEGRIYKNNKGKIICTKRDGQYAEFDFYTYSNDTGTPDAHERLEILVAKGTFEYEFVFSQWFMELHSTECLEYTEKLINTLIMIEKNLADAEFIGVAESENLLFEAYNTFYYKFQRTKYSKPVYFAIDDTGIDFISSETYEERYTKEPLHVAFELSIILKDFVAKEKEEIV